MRFTDIALRAIAPPDRGQRDYWDDGMRGFGMRVSQGGSKTFVILHNGNRRTLGRFPDLSLAKAREQARKLLAQVELGRTFSNTTFAEAFEAYIELHVHKNMKASSAYEAERVLRRHFDFGSKILDAIHTAEIMRIVDRLPPSAANHAFTHLRAFFRWCLRRRYIDRHPLEHLSLPNRVTPRDRVLTDGELRIIWHTAKDFPFPFGIIVMLLILTGQRVGEISALRWQYIDLNERLVTLPPAIVKNNSVHTFPLGDAALEIVMRLDRHHEFLFPSKTGVSGYDGHNKSKAKFEKACNANLSHATDDVDAALDHWTLHDLRRTFSTIQARIGTPPHVTEALLNHKTGTRSPIQRVYDRHTYLPEMRAALTGYEQHIIGLLAASPPDRL